MSQKVDQMLIRYTAMPRIHAAAAWQVGYGSFYLTNASQAIYIPRKRIRTVLILNQHK